MQIPEPLRLAQVPPPVLEVLQGLQAAGFQAFLVGGCVRDLLRGATPKDFDLATSARPEEVQRTFKKVIPTGIQHGTVTVVSKGHHVEVTTFRVESEYLDGRRPSKVEFHTEIDADLSRRDFTINAMAFDLRRLVDPFGGQADLAARTIRCVGRAVDRFNEDGLRALRAVRFATVLDFGLEAETQAAIGPTRPVFRKVAFERVHEELRKLLLAPSCARGLELLRSTGLLEDIAPGAVGGPFEAVPRAPADEAARLAVLLSKAPAPRGDLERLKLPTKVLERALVLIAARTPPPADGPAKPLRLWLRDVGREPEALAQALGVIAALDGPQAAQRLEARLQPMLGDPLTAKDLALGGKALMEAMGEGPGPRVGELSRHLLDQVLETPALNTPEALKRLVNAWCARTSDTPS